MLSSGASKTNCSPNSAPIIYLLNYPYSLSPVQVPEVEIFHSSSYRRQYCSAKKAPALHPLQKSLFSHVWPPEHWICFVVQANRWLGVMKPTWAQFALSYKDLALNSQDINLAASIPAGFSSFVQLYTGAPLRWGLGGPLPPLKIWSKFCLSVSKISNNC